MLTMLLKRDRVILPAVTALFWPIKGGFSTLEHLKSLNQVLSKHVYLY
jgi:hypothetical protein